MAESGRPFLDPNEEERLKRLDAMRGMDLLPEEIKSKLPDLYSIEQLGLEAIVQVKFFTPDANWTWYGSEYDGQDIFFGLVDGYELELGYFSLLDLRGIQGPSGLPIVRDQYFEPKSLSELIELHQKRRGEWGIER